ncbi:hypothetical protein, partial [Alkalibacillus haloalkaliphilus]|uniref:hypothetical protein n=1 Tax=Alkalibacillus haloalkaliphilus TaxID=94136 RepID=UPI002935977D
MEFWSTRPDDHRQPDELKKKAEGLLHGCWEHYRAGNTCVSQINGAVPSDMTEDFIKRAIGLLELP